MDNKSFPWKKTLRNIKYRCNVLTCEFYHRYGGRGIKCLITAEELKELWFRDKAYLMKKPSIDREDNDGNYTFDNCQYIEWRENAEKANDLKRKAILQYDLNGIFIKEWKSINDAARKLKIDKSFICRAIKLKHNYVFNSIFRYKTNKTVLKKININFKLKTKGITQYNIYNKKVAEFKSLKEAEEITGISSNSISHCLRKKQKTASGFIWRYKNEKP